LGPLRDQADCFRRRKGLIFISSGTDLTKIHEYFKNYKNELIVQPFMEAIIKEGEWSFIFFDREFCH
jgi:hypothetical protein